jgi:hypothetical protein
LFLGKGKMAYRNKTYVCFDGDSDIHYYRLMCAWKKSDNSGFNFYDAHDLNNARDTSSTDSIKKQLRVRLLNSSVFVLLVGEKTRYLTRFVRWELEQALSLQLPIIVVNLNGVRQKDEVRCPPIIRNKLAVFISFNSKILQYALEKWPTSDQGYRKKNESGSYYYPESVYKEIDL